MLKTILLQQKAERDHLLSKFYVPREQYESAHALLASDMIKVVLGPRRVGKSVFCLSLLKGQEFAYLNCDDEQLLRSSSDEWLSSLHEVFGSFRFLLLDEIQNVPQWELWVNKLHRRGYNLILTGSNADLLVGELATRLTGRYIAIHLYPFSFCEYLEAKNTASLSLNVDLPEEKGLLLHNLSRYLQEGGFPEVVTTGVDASLYLSTLFDAVLFKDVVKRYRIRYPAQMDELASYLLTLTGLEYSFSKLKHSLHLNSVLTVQKYVSYLESAYLLLSLQRFSFKVKEQMKMPRKAYWIDNGLVTAKAFRFSPNQGRFLENLVFIELLRRHYQPNRTLFTYKTRHQREIDFLIQSSFRTYTLIQVAYQMDEEATVRRETTALDEAVSELPGAETLILTWDTETELKTPFSIIPCIPVWKWLLAKEDHF